MTIKPDSHLQVGEWQYLPEQDKLVQFGPDGKVAVTAELDNLSQKVANYFIVKAGKLVTKDELLQDVWGIRDVSDGRVTRVIRVLRVALGDDTREPRYIETIPKRGYRFIAPVSEVVVEHTAEPEDHLPDEIIAAPAIKKTSLFLGALILLVAFFLSWMFWPQQAENSAVEVPMLRYSPLTSLDGLEFYQNISNDERYLVYSYASTQSESVTVLMLEDLKQHKRIKLTSDEYSSFGAAFSPDGKSIAYQRLNFGKSCEIRLITLDLDEFEAFSDEHLVGCGKNSVSSRLSWSPDGKFIVFADMADGDKQMALQMLSLNTKYLEKLTVPPVSSFGDFSARYSRKGDKLAFIRDAGGVPQIWVLNLTTRASEPLTKVNDAYPGNIDWTLDDKFIVFPSSASTISKVSMNGDVTLLAYTNNNASEIQITKSGDIVASVGYFSHVSPHKLSNPRVSNENIKETVFNSNRNEIFVEANPKASGPLAVVSKRSGLNQVWLLYPDNTQQQLTHFKDPQRIRGMIFSPSGSEIAVHLNQSILIFDFNGNYKEIPATSGANIGFPSWTRDGKYILYPEMSQGKWQIIRINVDNFEEKNTVAYEREFQLESYQSDYSFWRDSNTKEFFIQKEGQAAELLNFSLPDNQIQTQFYLNENGIYFSKLTGELSYSLYFYDFELKKAVTVLNEMSLGRFSVSADEKLIYTLEYEFADIDIAVIQQAIETL